MRKNDPRQLPLFGELGDEQLAAISQTPLLRRSRVTREQQAIFQKRFYDLAGELRVRVRRWRTSISGVAFYGRNEIEIPRSFAIAMHELRHIMQPKPMQSYLAEFDAEQFAISELQQLRFPHHTYEISAKGYVLSKMIEAHNKRRLAKSKIPQEVTFWLGEHLQQAKFEEWTSKTKIRAVWGYNWRLLYCEVKARLPKKKTLSK